MPSSVASVARPATDTSRPDAVLVPASTAPGLGAMRRWLGGALAVYVAALRVGTALGDAAWQWPMHAAIVWRSRPELLALSLLGAIPLGYFVGFALRRRRATRVAMAAAIAVECMLQILAAGAGRDVRMAAPLAAAVGALLGAAGFLTVSARLRGRAANDAALVAPDLPLVGGAYLATPLLWLAASAEATAGFGRGTWGIVALGLFGASLLGSARASRGPAGGGPQVHAATAAAWFLIGAAPLLVVAPLRVLTLAATIACFAAVYPVLLGMRGRERRIETPAVRRALPFLLLYATLSMLAPLASLHAGTPGSWIGWVPIEDAIAAGGWAEQVALFALLGYVFAELRGRREESPTGVWQGVARWIVPFTLAAGVLRVAARVPDAVGAPERFALHLGWAVVVSVLAARLGGALYALQRGHARAHASRVGMRMTSASARVDVTTGPRGKDGPSRRWTAGSRSAAERG